jgi:hypothetical protein
VAKRNRLAIDNSDLAGRSGDRFRAPRTVIGLNDPGNGVQQFNSLATTNYRVFRHC